MLTSQEFLSSWPVPVLKFIMVTVSSVRQPRSAQRVPIGAGILGTALSHLDRATSWVQGGGEVLLLQGGELLQQQPGAPTHGSPFLNLVWHLPLSQQRHKWGNPVRMVLLPQAEALLPS